MEAQAWTAIALLAATLLGSLFYLGNKIDSLGGRLDSRIDAVGGRLDARIDRLDAKIDGLTVEVRAQGAKLDDHLRWHAS
jgi:hypothetical protein